MTLILAYQNRGITRDITIKDSDGDAVTVSAADKVRAIIGREGETAKLTVTSGSDTDNGSSLTKNTPSSGTHRLRLDASDLDFDAGTYTLFVDMFDNSDAKEWKNVSREVFRLEAT